MHYVRWFHALNVTITQIFIFVMACSEESQKNNKHKLKKNDKNQLLQNGTDMIFDVGVSACGAIGDNQARKLDTKRIYTHG